MCLILDAPDPGSFAAPSFTTSTKYILYPCPCYKSSPSPSTSTDPVPFSAPDSTAPGPVPYTAYSPAAAPAPAPAAPQERRRQHQAREELATLTLRRCRAQARSIIVSMVSPHTIPVELISPDSTLFPLAYVIVQLLKGLGKKVPNISACLATIRFVYLSAPLSPSHSSQTC